jgi:hypothetical protein
MSAFPVDFDITNGLVTPTMPGWAYIQADLPVFEFMSHQPGSTVSLSNAKIANFAPIRGSDGKVVGIFATNVPRYIEDMKAAAAASMGNIMLISDSRMPTPDYVKQLTDLRFLAQAANPGASSGSIFPTSPIAPEVTQYVGTLQQPDSPLGAAEVNNSPTDTNWIQKALAK